MDLQLNNLSFENDSLETFENILYVLLKENTKNVEKILENFENRFVINETDSDGHTLLHLVAMKNPRQNMKKLIPEKKISIYAKIFQNKKIIPSAKRCNLAKMLIQNGANVNAVNQNSLTPLHLAVNDDEIDVAKILIENGANIELQDNEGLTPFHQAYSKNDSEFAKLLIQNGANIDAIDVEGDTALHYAVDNNQIIWVNFLLENGANLNIKNLNGDIPLFSFSDIIQQDTLATLAQHGANINALNGNGVTWLHEAIEDGYHLEFVRFLLSLGASPYKKNIGGFTPIEYALKTNNSMALKMMITYQQSGVHVQSGCIEQTQTRNTYMMMLLKGLFLVLIVIGLAMISSAILMIFLGSKATKEDDSCNNYIFQCMATDKDIDTVTLFSKETFLKNFYCDHYENQDFNFWLNFSYGIVLALP